MTSQTSPRVVACYRVLNHFMLACGLDDLTDGMYEGDPTRSYSAAQERQAEVLLDRANCQSGSQLLDIGCGYGRILRAAQARNASATGITISPEQMHRNRKAGLDVQQLDYKHLDASWNGRFDGIIANGSLEHFAQAEDAIAEKDDAVYRHLFETVHRLLRPDCSGRFVTTAIHARQRLDPADRLRPASAFPTGSPEFHWSRLTYAFGGWYPVLGQLERCAHGLFDLVHEEDGTEDYRRTSEEWLTTVRRVLWSAKGPLVWLGSLPLFLRHPLQTLRMVLCQLGSESWNWQFRGDPSPAVLLRQTWRRRPQAHSPNA